MSTLVKTNGFPQSSLFDDFFTKDLFDFSPLTWQNKNIPKVNIVESNEEFRVEMAAPGMDKSDFQIELDNDMLTISSERKSDQSDQEQKYTRREFSYESFSRSFYLPNTVESDKIEATYKNGVLSLAIPKKEEAKKKQVRTIKIS